MLNKIIRRLSFFNKASFDKLKLQDEIFLYAGDIGSHTRKGSVAFTGLSLFQADQTHIKHDVRNNLPLPDNSVSIYQSEDVFEHVEFCNLLPIVNEIYRVLKPSGLFRLSVPDYRCDILHSRSIKDSAGNIVFDPGGGGRYLDGKVVEGGHLWFPTFELIQSVMKESSFTDGGSIDYLHYYDADSNSITKKIDHTKGMVSRTPDFDTRVQTPPRAMSIVLDAYKS